MRFTMASASDAPLPLTMHQKEILCSLAGLFSALAWALP